MLSAARHRLLRVLAISLVLTTVASSCGGSDGTSTTGGAPDATAPSSTIGINPTVTVIISSPAELAGTYRSAEHIDEVTAFCSPSRLVGFFASFVQTSPPTTAAPADLHVLSIGLTSTTTFDGPGTTTGTVVLLTPPATETSYQVTVDYTDRISGTFTSIDGADGLAGAWSCQSS